MAKTKDITDAVITFLGDAEKIKKLQSLLKNKEAIEDNLRVAQEKLRNIEIEIASLVKPGSVSKPKTDKHDHPGKNTKAFIFTQIMSSKPMQAEELLKKAKEKGVEFPSIDAVRFQLSTYTCFKNVRGKGYVYEG